MPHPNIELIEFKDLSDSERGDGGFGSTGKWWYLS
jgi:dUTPase